MSAIFVWVLLVSSLCVFQCTALKCHTCESVGSNRFDDCAPKMSRELTFVSTRIHGNFEFSSEPDVCVTEFRIVPSGEEVAVRAGIKKSKMAAFELNKCATIDGSKKANWIYPNVTFCACSSHDFCNHGDTAEVPTSGAFSPFVSFVTSAIIITTALLF